jgi:thiamine biosynthesis lipoprotein
MLTALFAAAAITRAQYLMGTVCEVTAPPAAIESAFAEAARIEHFLSTWRDDSELSRLNATGGSSQRETFELLSNVVALSRETNGAFNPLVRPLIDLWKIRGEGSVPEREAIDEALIRTSLANVTFTNGSVALLNGARFEEGGFGKGYAIDRMLAAMPGDAADIVINFGGQIAVRGEHVVTIAHPLHRDQPLVTLVLANASLSTSSASEKSFTVRGYRFSHIVDPRTGNALPPRGSVSVIDSSALRADVLSTALYVMGRNDGSRWARAHGVHAIFISESGQAEETK